MPRIGESVGFGPLKVAKHPFNGSMVGRCGVSQKLGKEGNSEGQIWVSKGD
jgi:hypothetical protein